MPRQVSKGDVRHAHTSLKRAMSEWKAMNRNGRGDGENEEETEEAWTRLCEEIEDASAVVRGANAQGLNAKVHIVVVVVVVVVFCCCCCFLL